MSQPSGPGTPGFGLVSAATVGCLVVLAVLATWLARNETPIRGLWAGACNVAVIGRVVAWLRKQAGAWGGALIRRLPVSEVAGVALLIGAAVVTALAVCFTEVLDDVLEGDGIAGIDQPAAKWLAAHRDLWLTATLRVVTAAGGPVGMAALTALTCPAVVWRCRSWRPVVLAVVGGGGIAAAVLVAKAVVVRDRPALPFAAIAEGGYSFPSGHAAGTAAVTLLSAWLVTRWVITSWTGRVIVWTMAMGWSTIVGFSRIYLGVHYISDVLAGWLLGMAWGSVVVLVGTWWDSTWRASATEPGSASRMR
ncbi:phosphatase PAP2 family protein [Mycobacterium ostraviense]|uniref:Phosphatidic acid phosphatase n=1 Tax=Mycobacterium ostraviense TaxID=2738409 RepID=A0A163ZBA3_9MYCO|nr:phosphatase PAP2 family protein [Mycobacterium ostraviense]KZS61358.1 phosphatidic acid phosphatase [Mycobacterium ostraviense]UGT93943.1 phosphatase PAP2 family protein [Mycobacterium ostraviense]